MKKSLLVLTGALLFSASFAGYYFSADRADKATPSRFSFLTDRQKVAFLLSVNSDCSWEGIDLHGKVQIVDAFPDVKVQFVDAFPDLKVKWVDAFPDDCGEWQEVDAFPDFKIQVVDAFPDIKVQEVDAFPGL